MNYYTRFFVSIAIVTDEEFAWWEGMRDTYAGVDFNNLEEGDLTNADRAALDPIDLLSAEDDTSLGCRIQCQTRRVYLDSGDEGNVEHATLLVQAFLRRFRPHDAIFFQYACGADGFSADAFGGGAVLVTANGDGHLSTNNCEPLLREQLGLAQRE